MQYLRVEGGTLHLEDGPLSIERLGELVGGYFDMPVAFDAVLPASAVTLVRNADGRQQKLPPTVFVPELLEVVVGPVLLVGFNANGHFRDLTTIELEAFSLAQVQDTAVPRLVYRKISPPEGTP